MMTLLEISVGALLVTVIFGTFYVKFLTDQADELETGCRKLAADVEKLRVRQNVLEKRLAVRLQDPEKMIIEHAYRPDKDAPEYGGF